VSKEKERARLVDWASVEEACRRLATEIQGQFDCVVAVARGGLVPAALLAQLMEVREVHCLSVCVDTCGRHVVCSGAPTSVAGKRVLLVDDSVNTGATMTAARTACYSVGASHIVTLALWRADDSPVACDHVWFRGRDVSFPWELDELDQVAPMVSHDCAGRSHPKPWQGGRSYEGRDRDDPEPGYPGVPRGRAEPGTR
jgi:hypoxanthine phosphoribosyltransferase